MAALSLPFKATALAFKVTDAHMQCKGVQYNVGYTAHHQGDLILAESGFHFCRWLSDISKYYGEDCRVFIVQYGDNVIHGDDKSVTNQITLHQEINADTLEYLWQSPEYKALMLDNRDGAAALFASQGDQQSVHYILEQGANLHANNEAALRQASMYGHCDVVQLLLVHGADVHAHNDEALREASMLGHCDVVKLLLEHGAHVHADEDAALRYASKYGNCDVVELLLQHGADVHSQNDFALQWARVLGHHDVAQLLLEHGAHVLR